MNIRDCYPSEIAVAISIYVGVVNKLLVHEVVHNS